MLPYEHFKVFKEQALGIVDAFDYQRMVDSEVDSLFAKWKIEDQPRDEEKAIDLAAGYIQQWYDTGLEFQLDNVPISSFVADHRMACVWAVLLRREHEERLQQEPCVRRGDLKEDETVLVCRYCGQLNTYNRFMGLPLDEARKRLAREKLNRERTQEILEEPVCPKCDEQTLQIQSVDNKFHFKCSDPSCGWEGMGLSE